jgi:hypothetical protein
LYVALAPAYLSKENFGTEEKFALWDDVFTITNELFDSIHFDPDGEFE